MDGGTMGTEEQQPDWVVVLTSAPETTERDLRRAGYRVHLVRYRKLLNPHGYQRKPASIMVPLLKNVVFVQDWRAWPKHVIVGGDPRLMPAYRGAASARLSDADMQFLIGRERAGEFDDIKYPIGPGMGAIIKDDIPVGTNVEFDWLGRRVIGALEGMTTAGKALIATFFGRIEIEADELQVVAS